MHFSPFSVACYFLIDFSKILQITFPYSQSSLLRILRNREHGIEYISQNWWSKFHESSILILKFHKNIRKNTIARQARKIRPSNFQCYFLSVSCINGGNLKEFKIFDLTLNGWPAMECPFSYVSRGSIEFVILGTNALKINKVVFFFKVTNSNRIRWCILNLKIEFRGIFVKLFVDYLFSVYINGFRGFNLIADNVVFKGLSRAPANI